MMDFSKNDFSKARVDDPVWHYLYGWGKVVGVSKVIVSALFPVGNFDYYTDGRRSSADIMPSIFWGEIQFDIPEPPKRKVRKTVECWGVYNSKRKYIPFTTDTEKAACIFAENYERCYPFKLTGEIEIEEE